MGEGCCVQHYNEINSVYFSGFIPLFSSFSALIFTKNHSFSCWTSLTLLLSWSHPPLTSSRTVTKVWLTSTLWTACHTCPHHVLVSFPWPTGPIVWSHTQSLGHLPNWTDALTQISEARASLPACSERNRNLVILDQMGPTRSQSMTDHTSSFTAIYCMLRPNRWVVLFHRLSSLLYIV